MKLYCIKCALDSDIKEYQNAYFIIDGISVCTKHFFEKCSQPFIVKDGKLEYKNIELGQENDK